MRGTTLRYGSQRSQFGVLRRPRRTAASAVVVLVHGGFWSWPYGRWLMWRLARDVRARGWASFTVSYRRLGRFGGGGGWPATFTDVRDAVDRLGAELTKETRRVPVVIVGHSAGGHLALWCAKERPDALGGVVAIAAPTDLQQLLADGVTAVRDLVRAAPDDERWAATSPLERVPTGVPTVCIHGRDDTTVPPSSSATYVAAARAAGDDASAVFVDGEGHRDALRPTSASWTAAVRAIERQLHSSGAHMSTAARVGDRCSQRAMHVTSDRLADGDVANRWFPKVRSWFALGAPLELLSPLSVARIVSIVAAATWLLGGITGTLPRPIAAVLVGLDVVSLLVMQRWRVLATDRVPAVLIGHLVTVLVAVAASTGVARGYLPAVLLGAMAMFAGLFVPPSRLVPGVAIAGGAVTTVATVTQHGAGSSTGVVVSVFALLLAVTTAWTVRTARRAGAFDPDTGLANARGLADLLARSHADCDVVVATVHLRGVSEVRDALGYHAAGELVGRAVEDLGQVVPAGATIGRSADDDVVVVVPDRTTGDHDPAPLVARTVAQIATAIGTGRYLVGEIEVSLSTHIGIAVASSDVDAVSPVEVLRHSTLASRRARDAGTLWAQWSGESTTLTLEDLELLAELRTAAERGELWLAYQPQQRSSDRRIVAVEALLRWTSAQRGVVSPGQFIPLAERTGLVDRLTDWVLGEALDAQRRWLAIGMDLPVSVNVSPLSLRSVDFTDRVAEALAVRGVRPDRLMLEVTESMAFDIPQAVERLAPLHELGVKISIDDFGTGYTSLSVLPQLPLDELKVDQAFVRDSMTSPASEAITRSVCELAHRLGLSAVAEGVEDEELTETMRSFGFDLLQGYHIARPMSEADLVSWIVGDSLCAPDGVLATFEAEVEVSNRR
jgi:EAL domain-containing protein (putative c-di-GMP-specific phosphodiesterase class I)/acetyl esterase/lipase/GGDEF domain-containing protein